MREIKLSLGLGRYQSVSPFPIGDLDLYISGIPKISGDFRLLAWCNGDKIGEYTVSIAQPHVVIPREKLEAGTFSCRVDHYNGSDLVRHYLVEDLIIKELNTDLTAVPEINELREQVKMLETFRVSAAEELYTLGKNLEDEQIKHEEQKAQNEETVRALKEENTKTREALVKMVQWAYNVQNEVPYLDGNTADEFIQTLGIELSETEKTAIAIGDVKNEQQN